MTTPRTSQRPAARHHVPDMTDSIARFAREQPTAILVGAALAGLALGRLLLYSTEPAARRPRSRGRREIHEVHGMVAGAVPSTGQTAVAGGIYGD